MKIKPTVTDRIQTKYTSFEIEFTLEANITFIAGDSGTGRSLVYSVLREYAAENRKIRCFNALDQKTGYKTTIKKSKEKLFVIDNADTLLNDDLRRYIALDEKNQYIIFGRNPTGLMLGMDEIWELGSLTEEGITKFFLKHSF